MAYPVGTRLDIENMKTHCWTFGRVVWTGTPDADGTCKVGVEFISRVPNFCDRQPSRTMGAVGEQSRSRNGSSVNFRPPLMSAIVFLALLLAHGVLRR